MPYKNITKSELIEMLEIEKTAHESAKEGIIKMRGFLDSAQRRYDRLDKSNNNLRYEISKINADLQICERTIARLAIDETIRLDLEAERG